MRRIVTGLLVAVAAAAMATDADAQGRGGRGGFGGGRGMGFGGGGVQRANLLQLESVQEELGVDGTVVEEVTAAQRELRGERGQRGQRGNFRDMSEDERAAAMEEMRAARVEQQKKMNEKLAEILGDEKMGRLNEIFVQAAGVAALQDPMVADKLDITQDQTDEMQQVARDAMGDMREAFQSQDRDAIREKMEEIRASIEKDSLAVLTSVQKEMLDEMKGAPFELSEEDQQALRGFGRGGRNRGGDAGPGGGGRARGGRPPADE